VEVEGRASGRTEGRAVGRADDRAAGREVGRMDGRTAGIVSERAGLGPLSLSPHVLSLIVDSASGGLMGWERDVVYELGERFEQGSFHFWVGVPGGRSQQARSWRLIGSRGGSNLELRNEAG
jgi:hypothetical protein